MKIIILGGVLLLSLNCSPAQAVFNPPPVTTRAQTAEISEQEAIKIAEDFIVANGYTDLAPAADRERLVFESIEGSANVEEILESRRNTLQEKAYGILQGRKQEARGWTVVFRFVKEPDGKVGRAVTMDADGRNIRMEHVDIFLKAVEKKL